MDRIGLRVLLPLLLILSVSIAEDLTACEKRYFYGGLLPVERGGTFRDFWTALSIPYLSDNNVFDEITIGLPDQILSVNPSGNGYVWINQINTSNITINTSIIVAGANYSIGSSYSNNSNHANWSVGAGTTNYSVSSSYSNASSYSNYSLGSHWANDSINASYTNQSNNSLYWSGVNSSFLLTNTHNHSCANITGAVSDLCTITSGGGGGLINYSVSSGYSNTSAMSNYSVSSSYANSSANSNGSVYAQQSSYSNMTANNSHLHNAANITAGTFGHGNYTFLGNVTINDSLSWGNSVGSNDLRFLMWFAAIPYNPLADGFRMYYDYSLEDGPFDDWLIIQKTDGNDAVPDGGIGFAMTNSSNYTFYPLKLYGTGLANFSNDILVGGNVTADWFIGSINCSNITGAVSDLCTITSGSTGIINYSVSSGFSNASAMSNYSISSSYSNNSANANQSVYAVGSGYSNYSLTSGMTNYSVSSQYSNNSAYANTSGVTNTANWSIGSSGSNYSTSSGYANNSAFSNTSGTTNTANYSIGAGTTNYSVSSSYSNASGYTNYSASASWSNMTANNSHLHNAANITSGTFGTGNFTFPSNLTVAGNISTTEFFGSYNWTDDSPYLNFTGNVLSFNETELNNTIAGYLNTTVYYPTSFYTLYGTEVGGNNIGNLSYYDLEYFNVTEDAGPAPVLRVDINFTGVTTAIDSFIMRERYKGGNGHEVVVYLWDYTVSAWESYMVITDQAAEVVTNVPIADPTDHITGGVVRMRFDHISNGIATHYLEIDYVNLLDGPTLLTNIEHDSLSGRDEITNHPWALEVGGSRPLTANWSAGAYNISASWFIGSINLSQFSLQSAYALLASFANYTLYAQQSNYSISSLYSNQTNYANNSAFANTSGITNTANWSIGASGSNFSTSSGYSNNSAYSNTSQVTHFSNYSLGSSFANYSLWNQQSNYSIAAGYSNYSPFTAQSNYSIGASFSNNSNYANWSLGTGTSNYSVSAQYCNASAVSNSTTTWAGFTSAFNLANTHTHNAANITAGTFGTGNFVFDGDVLPDDTLTWDLGSGAKRWDWLYAANISADTITTNDLIMTGDLNMSGGNVTNINELHHQNSSGSNVWVTYVNAAGALVTVYEG